MELRGKAYLKVFYDHVYKGQAFVQPVLCFFETKVWC